MAVVYRPPMSRRLFVVHGARGSMPAPNANHVRYGGNTTCFSIDTPSGDPLIVDAGTGLAYAARLRLAAPRHFHLLITHYHIDHLLGLQSYRPLFEAGNRFTIYGPPPERGTLREAIAGVFGSPWFPVELDAVESHLEFVELDGTAFDVAGVEVTTATLCHPQGVLAYRLEIGPKAVVIATDHEADHGERDAALVELSRHAQVLVHDAQYTPEELDQQYGGWGHSTWRDAVGVATAAGVEQLVLTSHDPYRTDDEIDAIVAMACNRFPNTVGAYEGLEVPL